MNAYPNKGLDDLSGNSKFSHVSRILNQKDEGSGLNVQIRSTPI